MRPVAQLKPVSLQCSAALLAIAAELTGKTPPYQGVRLEPFAGGGVIAAATDAGKIAALLLDPAGKATRSYTLLPSKELIKIARPIKTAERTVLIDGDQIRVLTARKSATATTEALPLIESTAAFPPLKGVLAQVLQRWATPSAATAGRYDSALLRRALDALAHGGHDAIVLAGFDGGPLRLESPDQQLTVLLMPQTALPIPPLAEWLGQWAAS